MATAQVFLTKILNHLTTNKFWIQWLTNTYCDATRCPTTTFAKICDVRTGLYRESAGYN